MGALTWAADEGLLSSALRVGMLLGPELWPGGVCALCSRGVGMPG